MKPVKIFTERLASISFQFADKNNIFLLPVDIIKGEEIIKDDDDKKAAEFLKELPGLSIVPSTAVPPQGEVIKAFRKAFGESDEAIYITASSKLSAIYNVGKNVSEKLRNEGKKLHIFDSETVVSMEGMYAYEAVLLAKENKNSQEILNSLEKIRDERRIVEYGTIQTLKYLERNGRIGKAKAWLANLLSFKPIISAQNGVLEPVARARTNNQALNIIINKLKEDIKRTHSKKIKVMYDYGISDEYIRNTVDPRIKAEFKAEVVSFNQISTAVACHLGPEVWGVCAYLQ